MSKHDLIEATVCFFEVGNPIVLLFFQRYVSIVSRKKQTRREAEEQKMADKNDMEMNSIFYKNRETGTVMSYEEWAEYCFWGKAVIDSNIRQGVLSRVRKNAAGRWILSK